MINKTSLCLGLSAALALTAILPIQALDSSDSEIDTHSLTETAKLIARKAVDEVMMMPLVAQCVSAYLDQNEAWPEEWSVTLLLPDSGQSVHVGTQLPQASASTVKLFVAGTVLENYDELAEIYGADAVDQCLDAMITISDNDSATALVGMLGHGNTTEGKARVNAYCEKYGYGENTWLGILFTGVDPTGTTNATTTAETAQFLEDLLAGKRAGSEHLLNLMANQYYTHKIPALLPDSLKTANKTGELDAVQNDAAIIYADDLTYILCIQWDGYKGDELRIEPYAIDMIEQISAIVYAILVSKDESVFKDYENVSFNPDWRPQFENGTLLVSSPAAEEEIDASFNYEEGYELEEETDE